MFERLFENHDTLVFFDTETTGLKSSDEQIIELAAIAISKSGEREEMDDFIQLHCHPTVPEKITELTGITDEMIKANGIPEKEAIEKFTGMCKGNTLLIAYNAQFDLDFLSKAIERSTPRQNTCVF